TSIKINPSNGEIFVSAYVLSSMGYKWIVLKRTTQSTSLFSIVDDYQFTTSKEAKAQSLTLDEAYNVFVAGYAKDEKDLEHFIVRGSTDGGLSWNTYENFTGSMNNGARAEVLIAKGQGDLFVAGTSNNDLSGNQKIWIIRRIGVFSQEAKTIDERLTTSAGASTYKYLPKALCFSQDGGFIAGGSIEDNMSNYKVSILRKGYKQ
ncbi:MAG TPA: hypothetical protein PLJ21_06180, partial [Pseudobdellovibrionaceae bacterium]|nr:hypothetical protein [Pseudobdellovibrionaceae bacterium]